MFNVCLKGLYVEFDTLRRWFRTISLKATLWVLMNIIICSLLTLGKISVTLFYSTGVNAYYFFFLWQNRHKQYKNIHSNGKRGYQARPWTHKKHPNHVFFRYENRPLIHVFACIFLNLSVMSFSKFVYMTKNTPFFSNFARFCTP